MWLKKLNSAFQKQKNIEILSTGNSCRVGDYFFTQGQEGLGRQKCIYVLGK